MKTSAGTMRMEAGRLVLPAEHVLNYLPSSNGEDRSIMLGSIETSWSTTSQELPVNAEKVLGTLKADDFGATRRGDGVRSL